MPDANARARGPTTNARDRTLGELDRRIPSAQLPSTTMADHSSSNDATAADLRSKIQDLEHQAAAIASTLDDIAARENMPRNISITINNFPHPRCSSRSPVRCSSRCPIQSAEWERFRSALPTHRKWCHNRSSCRKDTCKFLHPAQRTYYGLEYVEGLPIKRSDA